MMNKKPTWDELVANARKKKYEIPKENIEIPEEDQEEEKSATDIDLFTGEVIEEGQEHNDSDKAKKEKQEEIDESSPKNEGNGKKEEIKEPFFTESMTAEEIARYFALGVEKTDEPVILDLKDKDGKGVQIEGIKKEDDDRPDQMELTKAQDTLEKINVYIDGKQAEADELVTFIEENKASFVAACNVRFPAMAEIVLAKEEELTQAEKDHILKTIDKAQGDNSSSTRPATEQDVMETRSLSETLKKASLGQARKELSGLRYDFLDNAPRGNAQFYVKNEKGIDVVEFSKFEKNENTFVSMSINGERKSEQDMIKYIESHPKQLPKQMKAYLSSQKTKQENKKNKGKER